jgi:hypothetical protein
MLTGGIFEESHEVVAYWFRGEGAGGKPEGRNPPMISHRGLIPQVRGGTLPRNDPGGAALYNLFSHMFTCKYSGRNALT